MVKDKLVAQTYDGAAMSGRIKGVQTQKETFIQEPTLSIAIHIS